MGAVAALVTLALAAAGCGGGGGGSSTTGSGAVPSSGVSGRSAAPGTHHRSRLPPREARLQAALMATLGKAGRLTGASVYDLSTAQTLFALRERVRRPPASVEKLYTSVALLSLLGPDARLHTRVLGSGHLGPGGTWEGDLYLRGGGDPTLGDGTFNRIWEMGKGTTGMSLARQLVGAGIHRVSGKVIGDPSLFDDGRGGLDAGQAPDIPDFGGQLSALTYDHGATLGALSPAAFAARQLALTLRSLHVPAKAARFTARAPRRAHHLASVASPPLWQLLQLMNVPSDDLFAEMLTKQLGVRFGSGGTIAAGAHVIAHTMANSYDLHPRIADGSGLSRRNSSSPAEIVALLRMVWRTAIGHVLSESLPVVGMGGTVRNIGVHTAAQGHCIAKTGTLNDVTNLAGYCHAHGGDMIAFALLLDGPANQRALVLLSHMVAAITRY